MKYALIQREVGKEDVFTFFDQAADREIATRDFIYGDEKKMSAKDKEEWALEKESLEKTGDVSLTNDSMLEWRAGSVSGTACADKRAIIASILKIVDFAEDNVSASIPYIRKRIRDLV